MPSANRFVRLGAITETIPAERESPMTLTDVEISELLTPTEAAAWLGLSGTHIRRLADEGEIETVYTRLGRLFSVDALTEYKERRLRAHPAASWRPGSRVALGDAATLVAA